ncbi:MAG: YHYH protein [Planctomycetota bacterium]
MTLQRQHPFALLPFLVATASCTSSHAIAHEWHRHRPTVAAEHVTAVPGNQLTSQTRSAARLVLANQAAPEIATHFEKFQNVSVRWDNQSLFIESNGLPDHNMMVGIRNWQQQVPVPQPFTGNNAWKLPLQPKLADNPISVRTQPLRGAIAIAINGVPIFCALNNRGEDAYLLGELDQWGGHCGRGDDYHYHTAPVHLESVVGKGQPIAFALDGFPIYGITDADGSAVGELDTYNGQFDEDGNYHYHATETFPYINGGLRGQVSLAGDQVEQPRDSPLRPGQAPLRGARITDFQTMGQRSVLTYALAGKIGKIAYFPMSDGRWRFLFSEPDGRVWSETYERRSQTRGPRDGGPPRRPRDQRGPGPPRR